MAGRKVERRSFFPGIALMDSPATGQGPNARVDYRDLPLHQAPLDALSPCLPVFLSPLNQTNRLLTLGTTLGALAAWTF